MSRFTKMLTAFLVVSIFTTCTKTQYITITNTPESQVDISLSSGDDYRFIGKEIISGKIAAPDTGYAVNCKTNGMQLGFTFRIHDLKIDSLYTLQGHQFVFWKDIFSYETKEQYPVALHITKKEGNFYSGYCTGWVRNNAIFDDLFVVCTFSKIYLQEKPY